MNYDLVLNGRRALDSGGTKGVSPRTGSITETEFVIDGGTAPTV